VPYFSVIVLTQPKKNLMKAHDAIVGRDESS